MTEAEKISNWNINTGNTHLIVDTIKYLNDQQVAVNFKDNGQGTGTGTVTYQINSAALVNGIASGVVSDTITVPSTVYVDYGSVTGATAGDQKITGLTAGKKYAVQIDGESYGVKANGTLGVKDSAAEALTGTEITGLTNAKHYMVVEAAIPATFEATDAVGAHNGVVYKEYKLMNGTTPIDLSSSNVNSISVMEPGATQAKTLTPDSDTTLWFNVDKVNGDYSYTVEAKDGKVYVATLAWNGQATAATVSYKEPADASAAFTAASGENPAIVDFSKITADKALNWTATEAGYYAIELNIEGVDLAASNVSKAIRVNVDGTSVEPEISGDLNAQYVTTKWKTGVNTMYYVLADKSIHKAVIRVDSLSFSS